MFTSSSASRRRMKGGCEGALALALWVKERRGQTLQTTAPVNEAFVRLIDTKGLRWQDRSHFLGIPARLMRRVLDASKLWMLRKLDERDD